MVGHVGDIFVPLSKYRYVNFAEIKLTKLTESQRHFCGIFEREVETL